MNDSPIKQNTHLQTPVLLVVFNRPGITKKVFDAVAHARPSKLYIAIDAPRKGNKKDEEKRAEVKEIVTKIDWNCELFLKEPESNLGVDTAVSSAVTWLFENEERGIILEDDCLADESFFFFCQELLERYKDEEKVMCITGNNFQNGEKRGEANYYLSVYPHTWGWATWRRAWKEWDMNYSSRLDTFRQSNAIQKIVPDKNTQRYWLNIFDGIKRGNIKNWDYIWTAHCWFQRGLTCIPNTNLVSNIGFGDDAQHTFNKNNRLSALPLHAISLPLVHPTHMVQSLLADKYTSRFVFQTHRVLKQGIKRVLQKMNILTTVRLIYYKIIK